MFGFAGVSVVEAEFGFDADGYARGDEQSAGGLGVAVEVQPLVPTAAVGIDRLERAIESRLGLVVDDVALVAVSQILVGHAGNLHRLDLFRPCSV